MQCNNPETGGKWTWHQGRQDAQVRRKVDGVLLEKSRSQIECLIEAKKEGEVINWDAVGAIGELIAAVAVIFTLAYLAVQTRQTKLHAITQTSYASASALRDELMVFIDPPVLSQALLKSYREPGALTDVENLNMDAWMQLSMHMRESEYFEWRRGTLSDDRWNALKEIIKLNLAAGWSRNWWQTHGKQTKTREFSDYVDGLVQNEGLVDDYFSTGNWRIRENSE